MLPPVWPDPQVIAHLRLCRAAATVICPVWPTRPWWHLICPDGATLAPYIIDWVQLPPVPDMFTPGTRQKRAADGQAPRWPVLALRVDFTPATRPNPAAAKRRRLELRRDDPRRPPGGTC